MFQLRRAAGLQDIFSLTSTMNLLICINFIVILLVSLIQCERNFHQLSEGDADLLKDNEEKIRNIFRKHSTINVLVSSHGNLITSLRRLLPQHSFVTYGFLTHDEHDKWISACQNFCYNLTMRFRYYERNSRIYYMNSKSLDCWQE